MSTRPARHGRWPTAALPSFGDRADAADANSQHDLSVDKQRPMMRVLFVGNSLTYQPKELGGVPNIVQRVAGSALGIGIQCDSLTKGGASIMDLWEDFETKVRGAGDLKWDVVTLQVGCASDLRPDSHFAISQSLLHRYGQLLVEHNANCQVILYNTQRDPVRDTDPDAPRRVAENVAQYQASLIAAGVRDVRIARVGEAFRAVQNDTAADRRIYPALYKDDMGHPSALAGLLIGGVVAMRIALREDDTAEAIQRGDVFLRPLERVLERDLPAAWRTASAGYAGEVPAFGQKLWSDSKRTLPAGLVDEDDEDLGPLSKYPPGTRTERRDLGPGPCDAVARAVLASALPVVSMGCALGSSECQSGVGPSSDIAKPLETKRRWRQR